MYPSLRARGNPPVHRRDAPLYRRTKLIRRECRREQQYGGLFLGTPPEGMRSGRFYNRFTNSSKSPRSASSHHPAFTTVYRISHYPPLRLANSSFPGRVPRVHPWGKDTRGTRQDSSQRFSRRNAVIDWVHRGWFWSGSTVDWYIDDILYFFVTNIHKKYRCIYRIRKYAK